MSQNKNFFDQVVAVFKDKEKSVTSWAGDLEKAIHEDKAEKKEQPKVDLEKIAGDIAVNLRLSDFEKHISSGAKELNDFRECFINDSHKVLEEAFGFVQERFGHIQKSMCNLETIFNSQGRAELKALPAATQEYFDNTVFALAEVAELRDPQTGYHLERTREYSVLLARELSLDSDFIHQLYSVGPLHDIGKVAIQDSILLKPGKLEDDEYKEMKKHTIIGADTIVKVIKNPNLGEQYTVMARDIALYHHEKFDGSGYPEGLKGEDIPLAARVFALADAYDAIVTKRPYKESLTHEIAVERITSDAGTHFDPEVVEAFVRVEREFKAINEKYRPTEM